jgi:ABC-type multidrug transport system fused ATPase/permease subunit
MLVIILICSFVCLYIVRTNVEELRVKSTRDSSEDVLNLTSAALLSAAVTNDHIINATIYPSDALLLKNSTMSLPVSVSAEWGWMPSSETCIYVYIGLILSIIFLIILRVISFFTMCTRASARLHDSMFSSITHATMAFFSHNPSGKVNSMLGYVGHSLCLISVYQSLVIL